MHSHVAARNITSWNRNACAIELYAASGSVACFTKTDISKETANTPINYIIHLASAPVMPL